MTSRNMHQPKLPVIPNNPQTEINQSFNKWDKKLSNSRKKLEISIKDEFEKLDKSAIVRDNLTIRNGLRKTRKRVFDRRLEDVHG
jgi:hypothetical protein